MVNGKAKVEFLTQLGVADAVVDLAGQEAKGMSLSKMIKKLAPKGKTDKLVTLRCPGCLISNQTLKGQTGVPGVLG